MNRPAPKPQPALRLVPPGPSLRVQCTWSLRKIRNLATTLRTDDRFGLLTPFVRARVEEELWAAIAMRKQLETHVHLGDP